MNIRGSTNQVCGTEYFLTS